jgi:Zn-dependent metalloprotease
VVENIARSGVTNLEVIAQRNQREDSRFRYDRIDFQERRLRDREVLLLFGLSPEVSSLSARDTPEKKRTIYTANNTNRLPGNVIRREGDPPVAGDLAANEAYDGSGDTYDFYLEVFGRNSIDGKGMRLDSTVHYGDQYDNAFWNSRQMVYGDGDGELFRRFTIALDVIGHELTHGVIEREARLAYLGQSGALNEHMADAFGIMVKQKKLNQTADVSDWLIGSGLFTSNVNGQAIRSMKAPGTAFDDPILGKDDQPSKMSDYVKTGEDNGGVHINSGIPNHAFYLAATRIGGFAWESVGLVWYETLVSPFMRSFMRFRGFARLTILVSGQIFGPSDPVTQAIREAWQEVEVL